MCLINTIVLVQLEKEGRKRSDPCVFLEMFACLAKHCQCKVLLYLTILFERLGGLLGHWRLFQAARLASHCGFPPIRIFGVDTGQGVMLPSKLTKTEPLVLQRLFQLQHLHL